MTASLRCSYIILQYYFTQPFYQNDTKLTPSWSWSQRSKHASFESQSAPPFKPTWTWACWGFFSEQLTIKLGVKYLLETWYFPSCTCRVCKDHLFSLLADISVMEVARPCPIITDTSWTTRYISFFCCRAFGDQGACFALLLLSRDDRWTIKDLKRSTNPTWVFSLGKLNVHQISCQDHL